MLDCQKRANKKWLVENYETISIRVPKGIRAKIKEWAADEGMSMAEYIKVACSERAAKASKTV